MVGCFLEKKVTEANQIDRRTPSFDEKQPFYFLRLKAVKCERLESDVLCGIILFLDLKQS